MVDAKHEAPADPCASHRSMGFHIDPFCPHCEAPAEGAGEEPYCSFCGDPCECGWLDADQAARSSAPEAREGDQPVAWTQTHSLRALQHGHTAVVYPVQSDIVGSTVALYTHPAATSADKLRIAVEALERIAMREYASEALAALKAE